MDTKINQYSTIAYPISTEKIEANPFVLYLNSMQSIQGNNSSALAESQSVNKHFSLIEEKHPLSEDICNHLLTGKNVILTGHAGDGKSTLAIEVFKQLSGLDMDRPLDTPLKPEEHIASNNITIIKDLSECADSSALLDRMLGENGSFLVITNTGVLLNMFKNRQQHDGNTESSLLKKLDKGYDELDFGNKHFALYNLARRDNLPLVRKVLIKMLDERNWEHCRACPHKDTCPILANRDLLASRNHRAVDRIFLIYRRLLAYGTRLTIRQILEHLAWSITGGKSICDAKEFPATGSMHRASELFHHLFFGNDGLKHFPLARHMRAIAALTAQAFGKALTAERERALWSEAVSLPSLDIPDFLSSKMSELRREGLHPIAKKGDSIRMAAAARTAVRRIVYFYGKDNGIDSDIDIFLASPFTRQWQAWSDTNGPDQATCLHLHKEIMFVLREHFSGYKTSADDGSLEIALHRDIPGLRQSVQLLAAQLHIRSTLKDLEWERTGHSFPDIPNYELLLRYTDHKDVCLRLDIAFLDFVHRRFCGEISGALSRAYRQRLEIFRNRLTTIAQTSDTITLLRFLTNTEKMIFQCSITDSGNLRII